MQSDLQETVPEMREHHSDRPECMWCQYSLVSRLASIERAASHAGILKLKRCVCVKERERLKEIKESAPRKDSTGFR